MPHQPFEYVPGIRLFYVKSLQDWITRLQNKIKDLEAELAEAKK